MGWHWESAGKIRMKVRKEKWKDARDKRNTLDNVGVTVLPSRCVWEPWTQRAVTSGLQRWRPVLSSAGGMWETREYRIYVLFSPRPSGTTKPSVIPFKELTKMHPLTSRDIKIIRLNQRQHFLGCWQNQALTKMVSKWNSIQGWWGFTQTPAMWKTVWGCCSQGK